MSELGKSIEKAAYSASILAASGLVLALHSRRSLQYKYDELAAKNAELTLRVARAEERATIDILTGLPDRSVLEDAFTSLQNNRHERVTDDSKAPHSLVLMDLDNFKKLNDAQGHPSGDSALQRVADIMRHHTRDHDVPVRWGGDEFALLLPRANADEASLVAERIRKGIEDACIGAIHAPITASIGITEINTNLPFAATYDIADAALYEAKEAGRNQIKVAALTEEI